MVVIIFWIVINDIFFDNIIVINIDIVVNCFNVVCESEFGGFNVFIYGNQVVVNFCFGVQDDIIIN